MTTSRAKNTRAAPLELGRYALTDDPRVYECDSEIHEREISEERDEQPFAHDEHETTRCRAAVVIEELDENASDPVDRDERADRRRERTPIDEQIRCERRNEPERQVEAQDVTGVGPEDLSGQWSEDGKLLAPAENTRDEDRAGYDEGDLADPREANEELEVQDDQSGTARRRLERTYALRSRVW